jgi:hypothetical protein
MLNITEISRLFDDITCRRDFHGNLCVMVDYRRLTRLIAVVMSSAYRLYKLATFH